MKTIRFRGQNFHLWSNNLLHSKMTDFPLISPWKPCRNTLLRNLRRLKPKFFAFLTLLCAFYSIMIKTWVHWIIGVQARKSKDLMSGKKSFVAPFWGFLRKAKIIRLNNFLYINSIVQRTILWHKMRLHFFFWLQKSMWTETGAMNHLQMRW